MRFLCGMKTMEMVAADQHVMSSWPAVAAAILEFRAQKRNFKEEIKKGFAIGFKCQDAWRRNFASALYKRYKDLEKSGAGLGQSPAQFATLQEFIAVGCIRLQEMFNWPKYASNCEDRALLTQLFECLDNY